ncbi:MULTISPECIES: MBL fold metallo-hydrolase [unclassified Herbaspirillum]|uniref:ComEC/Rec2 family competence protein n=1 Tax=unclassified Herbaspirillum TaxID=2624150 RepID=UPI0010720328|nr:MULTISPECIES: MBL fold metallo-hydrolase [unclassified Herbaspirillum]TFI05133.1 hypothetical protein E4P32_23355 [Herbaspirillum sp. 3R11]TFI12537.1 hypothetical protein E4P31_21010 [Herbaspirillum sp. 3R-11]TFI26389.1 hypothetical protein E4P30_11875 [Herbaspirillum sp. 3C11]
MDIKDGVLQIFDVDHGACALLTMPTMQSGICKRVLIDCGHSSNFQEGSWHPGNHLRQYGVSHIDLLICTNYDEDHASGAPNLRDQGITVGCILGNPSVPPEIIDHLKTEDGMGNGISLIVETLKERRDQGLVQTPPIIPGLDLSYFWNYWPEWDTENNLSLVAHLNILGFNFLFPGDMEKSGFLNMLSEPKFSRLMPGINVLIAAHHGRENGKCESMFDEYGCNPALVVISDCAKRHQSQETVSYYATKARGIFGFRGQDRRRVLTTRRDGEIIFRFENGQCFVL